MTSSTPYGRVREQTNPADSEDKATPIIERASGEFYKIGQGAETIFYISPTDGSGTAVSSDALAANAKDQNADEATGVYYLPRTL